MWQKKTGGCCSLFLRSILAGSIIVIASWAIENNLVYFCGNSGWVYDYDSFLGYWGNNLVYFWDYSGWVYDCDSFLGY